MSSIGFVAAIVLSLSAWAEAENPGESVTWQRDEARSQAAAFPVDDVVEHLMQSARAGTGSVSEVQELALRSDWPLPAREAVLLGFAKRLSELRPDAVAQGIVAFLSRYTSRVQVDHEEVPGEQVPLFPVTAAMAGTVHHWQRTAARDSALAGSDSPSALLNRYLAADALGRAGIEDALAQMDRSSLAPIVGLGLDRLPGQPALTGLTGKAAIQLDDGDALALLLVYGRGSALIDVLRRASNQMSEAALDAALLTTSKQAPASNWAMAVAEWGEQVVPRSKVQPILVEALSDDRLGSTVALSLVRWSDDRQLRALKARAAESPQDPVSRRLRTALKLVAMEVPR